jgi:light-regulated signal transduction histidine kinase (bacteriophytochrome)
MQQEPVCQVRIPQDTASPACAVTKSGAVLDMQVIEPDDLAGVDISHEVRTSLAIITLLSGNLDLLYERMDEEKRRKMIRDIRKHTRRLNHLIGDVLSLCNDNGLFTL